MSLATKPGRPRGVGVTTRKPVSIAMESTNVGDPNEQTKPDNGQYADLSPVVQALENFQVEGASLADKRLLWAGVKLMTSRLGSEVEVQLSQKFPRLFAEFDRLEAEQRAQPVAPVQPLPEPVPVEAPSIIFRGPGPAD